MTKTVRIPQQIKVPKNLKDKYDNLSLSAKSHLIEKTTHFFNGLLSGVEIVSVVNALSKIDPKFLEDSRKDEIFDRQTAKAKFKRRSQLGQSKYTSEEIANLEDCSVYFAEDSSSVFDLAFIRFLIWCKANNVRQVIVSDAGARIGIESITRCLENLDIIKNWLRENRKHFDSVVAGGLELLQPTQFAIAQILVEGAQKTWLLRHAWGTWCKKTQWLLDTIEGKKPTIPKSYKNKIDDWNKELTMALEVFSKEEIIKELKARQTK